MTYSSQDVEVKAFYMRDGVRSAPFVLEKTYGNGKLIFVNIEGYYNALNSNPEALAYSAQQVLPLIGIDAIRYQDTLSPSSAPIPRFVGQANMSGPVRISSDSLMPRNGDTDLMGDTVRLESITEWSLTRGNPPVGSNKTIVANSSSLIRITDLAIHGGSNVEIDSAANVKYLPSLSEYNYALIAIPNGSHVKINLLGDAYAEISVENEGTFKVTGTIDIAGIGSLESDSLFVLAKNPRINVQGKTHFSQFYSNDPRNPAVELANGSPLTISGTLNMELHHVGKFIDEFDSLKYVTYVSAMEIDGLVDTGEYKNTLRIPGDISDIAKNRGSIVPVMDGVIASSMAIPIILLGLLAPVLRRNYLLERRANLSSKKPTGT
jgi:hypothetical protein